MDPRIRIKLQRRLPVVWLLLLAVAAILLPGQVWTSLLVGLGGLLAIAYVWARQMAKGLSASRQLRFGWVAVGDRLSEQFEVHNDSLLPALWVEVIDESNVPGYRAAVVRSVGARATDRWRQSSVCRRRGQFTLGPWALHSADPFGIFQVAITYPEAQDIIIHPPIHGRVPIPLPAGQSSGRVRARQRSWQATINAGAIREYQPNDPYRWIHWPSSARHETLFVRQFDLDAAGDVWLLLDLAATAQLGQGADGTEEHAVLLAAALSAQGLMQNRAVGLASYGSQPQLISPGHGKGQQWKLLRALALVTADGESDLSSALTDISRLTRRGSAVVLITPSDRGDWLSDLLHLAQRGIRSHVILLDRASFGGERGSQGLLKNIRELGFNGSIVKKGEVGKPIEEMERRGFWEFKVTGTGKVVTVRSPFER